MIHKRSLIELIWFGFEMYRGFCALRLRIVWEDGGGGGGGEM